MILVVVLVGWGSCRKFLHAKTSLSRLEEEFVPSNAQTPTQGHTNHRESEKHGTTERTNEAPVTGSKEMEIYNLPAKDFKTVILKKLIETQEDIGRKVTKIRVFYKDAI